RTIRCDVAYQLILWEAKDTRIPKRARDFLCLLPRIHRRRFLTMSASTRFHQAARTIWEAQHAHPFVLGIGDGTLDTGRFGFWLRQDYLYLIDYSRLFAAAVVRAPDLSSMTRFADLLHGILATEMDL